MAGRGGLLDQIQKGAKLKPVDSAGESASRPTPPPKTPSTPARGAPASRPPVSAPPRDVTIERRPPPPTAPPALARPPPSVPQNAPPTPALPSSPPRMRAQTAAVTAAAPQPPPKPLVTPLPPSSPSSRGQNTPSSRPSAKSMDFPDAPIPQPVHMRMASGKHSKSNSLLTLVADIEPIPALSLAVAKTPKNQPPSLASPSFTSSVSLQLYTEHLRYNYPAAEAQASAGLYVNRRFASYLSKLCKACLDYYAVVDQATRKEAGLGAEFRKDGMSEHVDAFVALQSVFSTTSGKLQQFAQAIMAEVVLPIQTHHAQASTQLRAITDQHTKLFKPFLPLHSQRQRCVDKLSEFTALKSTSKAFTLKTKLDAEFAKFETMKSALSTAATNYHTATEPLLISLQQLEEARLRMLQNGLQELAKRCVVMDTSVPFVSEFAATAERLSEAKSLQGFASKPRVSLSTKDHSNNVSGGAPVPDLPPLPVLDGMSPPASPRPTSLSFVQPPSSPSAADLPPASPIKLAPKNIASVPSAPPKAPVVSASNDVIVEAQWDYPGSGDPSYDLIFNQGDQIRLLDNFDIDWDTVQDGEPIWVTGTLLSTGARGGFPTNFVTRVLI